VFTGLVEARGTVRSWDKRHDGAKVTVAAPFTDLVLGESISVSGACLTVTRIHRDAFDADLSAETLKLTTLGQLPVGARVNLERSTRADGRLGGHVVLGHVDGVGRAEKKSRVGDAFEVSFRVGPELGRFVATKGSIAIDGVSLTVNGVTDDASGSLVTVMLIPHTLSATTLEDLAVGTPVNVEVDVLARYVQRALAFETHLPDGAARPYRAPHDDPAARDARILESLKRSGHAG